MIVFFVLGLGLYLSFGERIIYFMVISICVNAILQLMLDIILTLMLMGSESSLQNLYQRAVLIKVVDSFLPIDPRRKQRLIKQFGSDLQAYWTTVQHKSGLTTIVVFVLCLCLYSVLCSFYARNLCFICFVLYFM